MAENRTQDSYYDDVIDLRELIRTLINYKWIITITTLLSALVAFLISAFLLSEQYEATSYVIITKPSLIADLEPSIQIDPSIPDTEALTHLFLADSILHEVYEIKEVDQALGKEIKFADFKGKFKAKLVGSSQLELLVIDPDPVCADLLADTWAQVVVDRLNTLYGTNQNAFIQLDTQLQTAKETWDEKQGALEISIAQSLVPALESQLSQEETKLSNLHEMIDHNEFLIADLRIFSELLSYRPDQQELRFEDVLAILTLQRRWVGAYDNLQIQVDRDLLLGAGYTVDQAQETIDNTITVISQDKQSLEDSLNEQEYIIPALTANLEDEQYKLDQLIEERDLARNAYTALSGQLEETRITMAQEDQIAKIAAGAHKPDVPVSPRKLMNTALAGLAGLILITGGVLLFEWWVGNSKPVPSGETVKSINKI